MSDMVYNCPNCGAEIKKSESKCPYCGFINEEGAEKKYMDRLYDLRDDLDTVDEQAAAGYGKSFGRPLKIIAITITVLIIITVAAAVISSAFKVKERETDPGKSNDMLEEMTWKKEAFSEFDSLYEQGEYEKMCEAVFSKDTANHNTHEWKHYWFATIYNDYLLTKEDLERIDKEGWSQYDAGNIFYRCSFCHYEQLYKNKYSNSLTDEEVEKLKPVIAYMNDVLHERLGFTDEDMEALKDELIGKYDTLLYDNCTRVGKEHMARFK